jgi:hypothetical protein
MFERFSDEARRTVVRALVEARLLGHDYVGTEHTLIALATAPGTASEALASEGVTLERARGAVAEVVDTADASPSWDEGPYTARARHTFELGMREAFGLDHHFVGNEHLLLGMLRLGQGNGVHVLQAMGVDLADLRQKVTTRLEGQEPPEAPPMRRSSISAGHRLAIHQPPVVDLREQQEPTGDHLARPDQVEHVDLVDRDDRVDPPDPRDQADHAEQAVRADQGDDTAEIPIPANPHACSFCGEVLAHGDRFIAGAEARICLECVRASARLLGAMDALRGDFTLVFKGDSRTATLSV